MHWTRHLCGWRDCLGCVQKTNADALHPTGELHCSVKIEVSSEECFAKSESSFQFFFCVTVAACKLGPSTCEGRSFPSRSPLSATANGGQPLPSTNLQPTYKHSISLPRNTFATSIAAVLSILHQHAHTRTRSHAQASWHHFAYFLGATRPFRGFTPSHLAQQDHCPSIDQQNRISQPSSSQHGDLFTLAERRACHSWKRAVVKLHHRIQQSL